MQPDATDPNFPGLTSQQEQATALLVSGLSVQEVADQLGVLRTTLWHWHRLETFEAHLNALRTEAREQAAEAVTDLHARAVATMERLMEAGGDAAAFRAAAFVLEAAQNRRVGEVNPRAIVRRRHADMMRNALSDVFGTGKDASWVDRRCGELGIDQ